MRDAFRSWGHAADVYALELDAELEGDGRRFADWRPGGPDDVVILHFALPSPLSAAFREHRGRRVLLHHNITPPEFFAGWDDEMARICRIGREELATLAPHCDLGLADSEFNRLELEALGVARTGVLPICLDFERYREPANPVLRRMLEDGATNLLFVGPPRAEQAARGPDPARELLEALPRAGRAAACWSASCPGAARLLRRAAGARLRGGLHAGRGDVPRPRGARRAPGLLPGRARVRVDERARGLRRAARRVDADARARAGLLGRGGAATRSAARACSSPRSGWRRWRRSRTRSRRTRRCAPRCSRARIAASQAFAPERVLGSLRAYAGGAVTRLGRA